MHCPNKNPSHRGCGWLGRSNKLSCYSTDKHLILAVCLINGLRHRRHEYLEATAEARHNRGDLARRLYHLRLHKISRQLHPPVCGPCPRAVSPPSACKKSVVTPPCRCVRWIVRLTSSPLPGASTAVSLT